MLLVIAVWPHCKRYVHANERNLQVSPTYAFFLDTAGYVEISSDTSMSRHDHDIFEIKLGLIS